MSNSQLQQQFNQANQFMQIGAHDKAAPLYLHITNNAPLFIPAKLNLGLILMRQNLLQAAIHQFHQALTINSKSIEAHHCIGQAYFANKDLKQAVLHFEAAADIDPHHHQVLSNLYHAYQMTCDWSKMAKLYKTIDTQTQSQLEMGTISETPFANLTRSTNPNQNLAVAQAWSKLFAASVAPLTPSRYLHNTPRIGYISADFKAHPIGDHLIDTIFAHDTTLVETHIFSYTPNDHSATYNSFTTHPNFHDISMMDDVAAAIYIRKQEIDILIDCTGHTIGHRPQILAQKPAPIQINYLGFPASMGASWIDYIIGDTHLIPKHHTHLYIEKVLYLDRCYQPQPTHTFKATNRDAHKLPPNTTVFAAFNNSYKITQSVFSLWMDILKAVPESVLWIRDANSQMRKNLQVATKKSGINKKRVIYAPKVPLKTHLNRLTLADIALDTIDYTGGATTANALFAGLPVITLPKDRYPSRMSHSMLSHLRLTEYSVDSETEYIKKAISISKNTKKHQEAVRTSPNRKNFFSPKHAAQKLEELVLEIMEKATQHA